MKQETLANCRWKGPDCTEMSDCPTDAARHAYELASGSTAAEPAASEKTMFRTLQRGCHQNRCLEGMTSFNVPSWNVYNQKGYMTSVRTWWGKGKNSSYFWTHRGINRKCCPFIKFLFLPQELSPCSVHHQCIACNPYCLCMHLCITMNQWFFR